MSNPALDDLKATVTLVVEAHNAKLAAIKAELDAEKASHDQTRQALAEANAVAIEDRNAIESLKSQLAPLAVA